MRRFLPLAVSLLAGVQMCGAQERPADMRKSAIELPTARLLKSTDLQRLAPAAAGPAKDGHYVRPGLVNWHADYSEALQAAKESRKPILVLQMMGRLDDKFC